MTCKPYHNSDNGLQDGLSELKYSKRMWLNREDSPSTGSVAAYRGSMPVGSGTRRTAFLEVADCHGKVRLHVTPMDTMNDFISKMEALRDFIDQFVTFLKDEQQQ